MIQYPQKKACFRPRVMDRSCFTKSIQEVVLKLESKSITLALFELPLL